MIAFSRLHSQTGTLESGSSAYVGFGRQGLTYLKAEQRFYLADWTYTIINLGFGGIPGDAEYGIPRTNKIMPQVGQLFGKNRLFLEIGIEPSINFYGGTSYTDLNGIIGLRYHSRFEEIHGLFFQAGYNPRLYNTFESGIEVAFYLGIGLNLSNE
ncbi:MAG: hypothetical protein IPP69_08930 [Flavobacteriales bacterium]|nr:hypothetical protein [Flavobacteriales bacterium]